MQPQKPFASVDEQKMSCRQKQHAEDFLFFQFISPGQTPLCQKLQTGAEQRTKKKTLQTQNIGDRGRGPAPMDVDGDGIPDLPPEHHCDH